MIKQKLIDEARKLAMNKDIITKFFDKYHHAVTKYKIKPNRTYNTNETGMRLDVGRGQWVIVSVDDEYSRFHYYLPTSGSTEHITVIETICGDGTVIAPIVITKGVMIQARWFADITCNDYAIGVSESGYSNDHLSFIWLQHFNRLTKPENSNEYRMLILDGYDSRFTVQFVRYCELHRIILFQLPPHTSHFLQPLDVTVFQQWKHWHAEAINHCIRHSIGEFNRLTFFSALEDIRKVTFTKKVIQTGFRRYEYISYSPQRVLRE